MGSSKTDHVYNHIVSNLLDGTLRAGSILNRRIIAQELGVSVSPVGEAFYRLEHEGLIITVPRKATVVAPLDTKDLAERYMIRVALECQAARLYCGEPVQKQRSILTPLAEAVDTLDPRSIEFIRADLDFHRALIQLVNNKSMLQLFDQFMSISLLLSSRVRILQEQEISHVQRLSHLNLLELLSSDDPDLAEKAIRMNIENPAIMFG